MGKTITGFFAVFLLCTSCTTFQPERASLIRDPEPVRIVGSYFHLSAPFSSSKLLLKPDRSFEFSYEMMDSYVEAGYPDEGPIFHGTWEETSGTWSVIGNELHLSFQSPTKKEIEETYLLYIHKGRSTLVPKEKKRDFFRTIRHHPDSYDYSSDKAPSFRIGQEVKESQLLNLDIGMEN